MYKGGVLKDFGTWNPELGHRRYSIIVKKQSSLKK